NDFSAARRGYDPDEVDRHLREIAHAVAALKRAQKRSPSTIAAQAAEQVRGIVEAAERSAADIQEQAEGEAKRITDDASGRARETRERADAEAAAAPAEAGGRSIGGAEAARLIAPNMALNGTPRDGTARDLSQKFELDDQDALLDEVYARVGG